MVAPPDPGQLLVVGIEATEVDDAVRRVFAEQRVGGVILFQRNAPEGLPPAELRAALRALLADLRAAAAAAGLPEPFLMVDHEGGRVHRFGEAVTRFPPPGHLAPLGVEAVTAAARHQASELRALGFNTVLGPVLDVCPSQGTASHIAARSYSGDPAQAAALGVAALEAYTAGGLLCTPKHFPGYGAAPIDPHLDLPTRTDPLEALRACDLVPFQRAIDAGCAAIMTAHIVATGLDPELPCTLSAPWLRLLREELGFAGCVVSDDLCMASVRDRYGPADLSERCLRAGLDLLLVCHPGPETLPSLRAHLRARAEADPGFAARVADAQARVAAARARLRGPTSDDPFGAGEALREELAAQGATW